MPVAKRSARLSLAVVLLATSLLAPGILAPPDATAKNLVEVNNRTKLITIVVQADLVGGDDAYAEYLQQSFKEHWGQEFTYRCYTVKITLDIEVFPAGELPADDAPRHRIVLDQIDPGDPYRASAQWPHNYRPSNHSGEVHLSNYSVPGTVAHELGHILGLPDEYTYVDTDGNGSPSAGEPSIPDTSFPDVEWSLMADSRAGGVLQRHIDKIAGLHAPRGSLECKWQGSLDIRVVATHPTAQNTHTAFMSFTMNEDGEGVLEGTGSATIAYEGGGTTECGPWTGRSEPIAVDIALSGQRTDETMSLRVAPSTDTQTVDTVTTCGGETYSYAYDAWWLVTVPDWPPSLTQAGLTFALDDYVTHTTPDGVRIETWNVIIVEPVDDEGEPVG